MSYYTPIRSFQRPDQPQPIYYKAVDAVVAKWAPIWVTEILGERVRERSPLETIRPIWASSFGLTKVIDPIVAKWAPIWRQEILGERSRERPSLETLRPKFEESFFNLSSVVDLVTAKWAPIWRTEILGERSRERPNFDVIRPIWVSSFGITKVTDPIVAKWNPIWEQQHQTFISNLRSNDVRTIEYVFSWIFQNLPTGLTVAQMFPAFLQGLQCLVNPNNKTIDLRNPWDCNEEWTFPITDSLISKFSTIWISEILSELSKSKKIFDTLRADLTPEEAWLFTSEDKVTAIWSSVFSSELKGIRSDLAPQLDLQRPEWRQTGWVQPSVDSIIRTMSSVFSSELSSFISNPNASLDLPRQEWRHTGWIQPSVDAILKTWTSIFQSELKGIRSDSNSFLDLQRPEWRQVGWIQSSVDSVVKTWISIFQSQLKGERSSDIHILDVRNQAWNSNDGWVFSANDKVVASWISIFNSQKLGIRSADFNHSLPQDFYNFPWIFQNLPTFAINQLIGAFILGMTCFRSGDRNPLDVRTPWAPNDGWVYPVNDSIVKTWLPIWQQELRSFISDRSSSLDVKSGSMFASNSPFIRAEVDSIISQFAPIWSQEHLSFISSPRSNDIRTVDIISSWIYQNLVFGISVSQMLPAFIQGLLCSRSLDGKVLDIHNYDWSPAWFSRSVDLIVAKWAPVFIAEPSFRNADGKSLNVRGYEWNPQIGWLQKSTDNVVAMWSSVFNSQEKYRSSERSKLDLRVADPPEFSWVQKQVDSIVSLWTPAFVSEEKFRSAEGKHLELRGHEWNSEFGWAYKAADLVISKWAPVFHSELLSFRSSDKRTTDVRTDEGGSIEIAWIQNSTAHFPSLIQAIGIILLQGSAIGILMLQGNVINIADTQGNIIGAAVLQGNVINVTDSQGDVTLVTLRIDE